LGVSEEKFVTRRVMELN